MTYGDLMSYLMIFFLLLFSFAIAKTDKSKSRKYEESLGNIQKSFGGEINKERIERAKAQERENGVVSELESSVKAGQFSSSIQIEAGKRMLKLVLGEAVLFDSGRAALKPKAKEVLTSIISELKRLPNDIIVAGHTDNVPIGHRQKYATNWELSMSRAYSVVKFMQEEGISPKQLAGIGYGENRPVSDNSTAIGRSKNRRIEISLMKTE